MGAGGTGCWFCGAGCALGGAWVKPNGGWMLAGFCPESDTGPAGPIGGGCDGGTGDTRGAVV